MHHRERADEDDLDDEVAVGHGVDAVLEARAETELSRRHVAVERQGRAGERATAERRDVGPRERVVAAVNVAREDPDVARAGGARARRPARAAGACSRAGRRRRRCSAARSSERVLQAGERRAQVTPGARTRGAGRSPPGRCGCGRCAAWRRPARRARRRDARRRCGCPRRPAGTRRCRRTARRDGVERGERLGGAPRRRGSPCAPSMRTWAREPARSSGARRRSTARLSVNATRSSRRGCRRAGRARGDGRRRLAHPAVLGWSLAAGEGLERRGPTADEAGGVLVVEAVGGVVGGELVVVEAVGRGGRRPRSGRGSRRSRTSPVTASWVDGDERVEGWRSGENQSPSYTSSA